MFSHLGFTLWNYLVRFSWRITSVKFWLLGFSCIMYWSSSMASFVFHPQGSVGPHIVINKWGLDLWCIMSSVLYGAVFLPCVNQHVKCQSVMNCVLCKILSVTNSKPFVFSKELGCQMNFAVYLPPQAEDGEVPVIYWLSGLTCTEQNFIMKSGVQHYASEHGIIIVAPDTSPSECEFF